MAHVKRYKVFHAMTGSFPMYVNEFSDRELALEVASGQPDGSGFVIEVLRDLDPGVVGGMDREVRHEAEQAEGAQRQRERRDASGAAATNDALRTQTPEGKKQEEEVKKAAGEELERTNQVVEKAAKETERKPVEDSSTQRQQQSQQRGTSTQRREQRRDSKDDKK